MGHIRPEITDEKIEQIKSLLKDNPNWHRTRLSIELCELWDWKSDVGQPKDISCRDLLRALELSGKIVLPLPKRVGRGSATNVKHRLHDTSAIETNLKSITPLTVDIAKSKAEVNEFKSYIDQYHYLAYGQSVGECMRYIVRANTGQVVACLLFGSSAWRCSPRDKHIGWNDDERAVNLHLTTNNTRFLIPQWVRVPHLASHVLALISRRVSSDWQEKYGHPIILIETFVDKSRFRGVCYQAANWLHVGETTGRGRNDRHNKQTLPIKGVYIYPLTKNFKTALINDTDKTSQKTTVDTGSYR